MHFAEFSRADEIDAARRRTFDTLELDTRERSMVDPQQAVYSDEANLVIPGSASMRVMVEPMEFPSMDRATRREQSFTTVGGPAPIDPAEEARLLVAEARTT